MRLFYPTLPIRALLAGIFFAYTLNAQENSASDSLAPLFSSDAPLELRIEADFKGLLKDIRDEREYHAAVLKYAGENGDTVMLPLKIMARGNFRRDPNVCNFPPLMLNFKKKGTGGTVFEGQNKLKLVTHCQDKRDAYEQYLLLEYLTYRCYSLFAQESFQVRLAHVTYADSFGNWGPYTKNAFLLEDVDDLAARCGGEELGPRAIHPDQTQYERANLVAVFMYFVGNTDFSIAYQHNIKLISKDPLQSPIPVPYDFDWSGIVSPPYARPNPDLGITSVKQRLFRGFCRTPEEFEAVFDEFRANKDAIYALFNNQEGLEEKTLEKTLKFIDDFYEVLDNPKAVKREFLNQCRTDK